MSISLIENIAVVSAKTMSQADNISIAPPRHKPLTRPITGTLQEEIELNADCMFMIILSITSDFLAGSTSVSDKDAKMVVAASFTKS